MAIGFFAHFSHATKLHCVCRPFTKVFVGIDYISFSKTQTCMVVMVLQFQSVCFGTLVCPDRTRLNMTEEEDYGDQP